jgi:uncharacterized protein YciI
VSGSNTEANDAEVTSLLAPMVRHRYFALLKRALVSADEMEPHLALHLRYWLTVELQGKLFGSGPFVVPGQSVGDGLTIVRAVDEAQARAIGEGDPLYAMGMRTFDLREWELREGGIRLTLRFGTSSFVLDS